MSFGIQHMHMALGLQRKARVGPATQGEEQVWPTHHHMGPTPRDPPLEDILLPFPAMLGSEQVSTLLLGGQKKYHLTQFIVVA